MDTVELRAAAERLRKLHERFAPCFGRRECREHSLGYLRGLLLAGGRKSVEPMALLFGGPRDDQPNIEQNIVLAWQRFLTVSPWEAQDVQQELQAVFNEEFVPTASRSPIGTVGVIDGSGFVKHGSESIGVQRQWCGRVGKKENCQVGVFLLGVTPAGSVLLDHQLYLPEAWAADAARRKKTRVPPEITFQTKPQIAALLLAGVPCISTGSRPMRSLDATAIFWTPWKGATNATWLRCPRTPLYGPTNLCGKRRTNWSGR